MGDGRVDQDGHGTTYRLDSLEPMVRRWALRRGEAPSRPRNVGFRGDANPSQRAIDWAVAKTERSPINLPSALEATAQTRSGDKACARLRCRCVAAAGNAPVISAVRYPAAYRQASWQQEESIRTA